MKINSMITCVTNELLIINYSFNLVLRLKKMEKPMQEIDIKTNGIVIDESIRKYINQRLHSVFGFDANQVRKIVITLINEENIRGDFERCCHIEVWIIDRSPIITELKSLDIFTAISLAIERAHLKLSHNIRNDRIISKQAAHTNIYQ
jgi:ribosome-associated translation inhibitor RaiA